MLFAELLHFLAPLRQEGSLSVNITGIAYDSREVQPGYLFVAVPGFLYDGHNFLLDAAARGAVAAIISRQVPVPSQLSFAQVADSRKAMAEIARVYYGDPSTKLRLVGVTGTNGKTTTTFLVDSILSKAGRPAGIIGTVKVRVGATEYPVKHTTPEAVDLQHYLDMMVKSGLTHGVMEVSSHSLALDRVVGCEFDVGVFTNLTQDHLDMHGSMEQYFLAKARLFEGLGAGGAKPSKAAVINLDDPYAEALIARTKVPVTTYGITPSAALRAEEIEFSADGTSFTLCWQSSKVPIRVATPGLFSVYNALAAAGVAINESIPLPVIADALAAVPGIPGRFQPVRAEQAFDVIVDYAHTPDGLRNILHTARGFSRGKVILVFGCGGDRDRGKRPQMGEIASSLADLVIVTSDNPRSEDPLRIIADIMQGISPSAQVEVEPDRKQAIFLAIRHACPGDVILIAGKGHETYQIIGNQTIHFDDREVAELALEALEDGNLDP